MIGQEALLAALRRMQVETGSLVCLGCGYEHNCSIHGCAILREAVKALEAPEPAAGKSLTVEQLQAVPHGKVKDNTLNDICKRANEIAMQRVSPGVNRRSTAFCMAVRSPTGRTAV